MTIEKLRKKLQKNIEKLNEIELLIKSREKEVEVPKKLTPLEIRQEMYRGTKSLEQKEAEMRKIFPKIKSLPSDTYDSIINSVRPVSLDEKELTLDESINSETYIENNNTELNTNEEKINYDHIKYGLTLDDLLDIFNELSLEDIKKGLITLIINSKKNEIKISDLFCELKGKKYFHTPQQLFDDSLNIMQSAFIKTIKKVSE